jgi:dihydrofolate reductase
VTIVSVIVAMDERGGIGRGGRMPWYLPADLRRFKALTMGKPILMGRRTWDSIGRPLPGRRSIVVSRRSDLAIDGAEIVGSLEEAVRIAGDVPEICCIGGAEIYRLALPLAQVIHLTRVHAVVDADTFFPSLDAASWEEISREDHAADERHAHPYSFLTLQRSVWAGRDRLATG